MKFKFSFQKLLELKNRIEEEARRQFTEARDRVDKANAQLKSMYEAIDSARNETQNIQTGPGFHSSKLMQLSEFIEGQYLRIDRFKNEIRVLMGKMEETQMALVEAARERKTLEKLREKQVSEFKVTMNKRELKKVDDLTTMRSHRRMTGR